MMSQEYSRKIDNLIQWFQNNRSDIKKLTVVFRNWKLKFHEPIFINRMAWRESTTSNFWACISMKISPGPSTLLQPQMNHFHSSASLECSLCCWIFYWASKMNDRELTITALFSYSNAQELKEAAGNDRHNPVMGTHLSTIEVNDGRHCLKKTLATLSACYSHWEGGTGAWK